MGRQIDYSSVQKMFSATAKGNVRQMLALARRDPRLLTVEDSLGANPAHYAVGYKQYRALKLLALFTNSQANIRAMDICCETPFDMALETGDIRAQNIMRAARCAALGLGQRHAMRIGPTKLSKKLVTAHQRCYRLGVGRLLRVPAFVFAG